jgi:hypothetical protein
MLDQRGEPIDTVDYDGQSDSLDDCPYHAPSEYVASRVRERRRLRSRDLNELQELWREETRRRKRERAPLFKKRLHGPRNSDD